MSGGSLNYAYSHIDEVVRNIVDRSRNPLHLAFVQHLVKISKALYDLEWVLSSDYSEGAEEVAIRAVLQPADEIESAKKEAEIALQNLEQAIKNASDWAKVQL